jgi:acetyl esterase/lipase
MRSMIGLAALFVTVSAAGAQGPRDTMKIPVFYSVPGTETVRVEREIVFRTAGDTILKADIYLPAARGTYPVVLLVSGGAVNDWRTSAFYTTFARVLAAEGIAAVNYDKRLARDRNAVLVASDDSLALVDHLKSNAAK